MVRKIMIITIFFNFQIINCFSSDSAQHVKTGLTFGALPSIAFDTDIGFKYGLLTNFYLFGDGSTYPKYRHSLFMEWFQTTKGSGLMQLIYDSEYLIPNIRLTAEASYITEQALDFYGFNGYTASYFPNLADPEHPDYISRMFYRHERKMLRLRSDFQGSILGKKLRWLAGFEHNGFNVGTVDIDKLNRGKSDNDKLPKEDLLYDKFVEWGVIPYDEKDGGNHNLFKFGLVFDTRDNEPNPMKGIWSEIYLLTAPAFLGNKPNYSKLAITHRHYFTLVEEVLNLAVRLSYQPKVGGTIPFYSLPFIHSTNITRDGLGGAKTMRGILRNRVVGDDILYGNVEMRWKFIRTILWNQHLYFALSAFSDFGRITSPYEFTWHGQYSPPNPPNPDADMWFSNKDFEKMHISYGIGISGALNHNFVAQINYGRAVDKRDGKSGLYIGLNFLY